MQALPARLREDRPRIGLRLREVEVTATAIPRLESREQAIDVVVDGRFHLRIGGEAEREQHERLVDGVETERAVSDALTQLGKTVYNVESGR